MTINLGLFVKLTILRNQKKGLRKYLLTQTNNYTLIDAILSDFKRFDEIKDEHFSYCVSHKNDTSSPWFAPALSLAVNGETPEFEHSVFKPNERIVVSDNRVPDPSGVFLEPLSMNINSQTTQAPITPATDELLDTTLRDALVESARRSIIIEEATNEARFRITDEEVADGLKEFDFRWTLSFLQTALTLEDYVLACTKTHTEREAMVNEIAAKGTDSDEFRRMKQVVESERKTRLDTQAQLVQDNLLAAAEIVDEEFVAKCEAPEKGDLDTIKVNTAPRLYETGYVYNELTDTYIVPLKAAPRPLVITGDDHRAILENYSNWITKGATINEIARKFNMPRAYFNEYKRVFSITHDREPISAENLLKSDTGKTVDNLLEKKRFALHQEWEAANWKRIQKDAEAYGALIAREFNPLERFLDSWKPPVIAPLGMQVPVVGDDVLIVGLTDLHFGLAADKRYLFKGKTIDTDMTERFVDEYAEKIMSRSLTRATPYKKIVVCMIGDILHGLRGHTEKGTPLEADKLRDDQLDYAFRSLTRFIARMREVCGEVEIHNVRGNHDGVDNYALGMAISAYFRTDETIKFNNYSTRTAVFRVKDVLCIIDHGESDTYKAHIPSKGKERESYIQSLLLTHPEKLIGVKQKVFIQGHMHHYENIEMTDFEFFMFGAISAVGDKYADNHNWNARQRQNALVVSDEGITERLSFYFGDAIPSTLYTPRPEKDLLTKLRCGEL